MRVAFNSERRTGTRVITRSAGDAPLVIRGGTLVDPSGAEIRHDIFIESTRIAVIAPSIRTDAGVLDADGMIVVPGLVDPWFDPEHSPLTILKLAAQLQRALQSGVTTAHLPNVSDEIGRAIRQGINERLIPGPRILLSTSAKAVFQTDAPLARLRRSLGFGADLLLIDGLTPAQEKLARKVASDLKKQVGTEAELRARGPFGRIRQAVLSAPHDAFAVDRWAAALGIGSGSRSIHPGARADIVVLRPPVSDWRPLVVMTVASDAR